MLGCLRSSQVEGASGVVSGVSAAACQFASQPANYSTLLVPPFSVNGAPNLLHVIQKKVPMAWVGRVDASCFQSGR